MKHTDHEQWGLAVTALGALLFVVVATTAMAQQRGADLGQQGGTQQVNQGGQGSGAESSVTSGSESEQQPESSGGAANNNSGETAGQAGSSGSTDKGPSEGTGSGQSGGSGGASGGKGETTAGNNLSFPVIAADGLSITAISSASFTVPYTGTNTGLSAEELAALVGSTWYAQKTIGNTWQAGYVINPRGTSLPIFGVDWGDNIESVHPLVGQPFRLEITLYAKPVAPLKAFTMAVLANPSSPDEIQGTNGHTYDSALASIASPMPALEIQYLGESAPADLAWNGSAWTSAGQVLPQTQILFGPELNVAGKYTYGVSEGGWRPVQTGVYRLTLRFPMSDLSLANAVVGNVTDWIATSSVSEGETGSTIPVIDGRDNITYVDVAVVTQRSGSGGSSSSGGGKGGAAGSAGGSGSGTNDALTTLDASVSAQAQSTSCEPYLTTYLYPGAENDSSQVVLLQTFLNKTMGTTIPLSGYFGRDTQDAVKSFQTLYANDILKPWRDAGYTDVSLNQGTGNVYVTTLAKINSMSCSR